MPWFFFLAHIMTDRQKLERDLRNKDMELFLIYNFAIPIMTLVAIIAMFSLLKGLFV